ncbi:hypothetical protein, partial [Streptomyces stelliscabiei]|uniref:hypothetical protein n=1 Tax=Streptomyces stelliscabiei TaxID=146820 RepID=UPI001F291EBC
MSFGLAGLESFLLQDPGKRNPLMCFFTFRFKQGESAGVMPSAGQAVATRRRLAYQTSPAVAAAAPMAAA